MRNSPSALGHSGALDIANNRKTNAEGFILLGFSRILSDGAGIAEGVSDLKRFYGESIRH
jgi:hypothetical protein